MKHLPAVLAVTALLAVAAAAYLFNMGWFRVIGLLPAAAEALLWAALAVGAWSPRRWPLWTATAFTFVAFHVLLPDFGDIGPPYAFFGLWKDEGASEWLLPAAAAVGVAHLVLLAWLGMAWSNEGRSANERSGTKE